ncbi:hypothetical protein COY28_01630, partial [Candidatus Woesearchaeota archaeon CG_4_10_14_0_2_um_filter_57_5]
YYAAFSLMMTLYFIADLRLGQALIKFLPEYLHDKDYGRAKGAFLLTLGVRLVITAFIALMLVVFAGSIAEKLFHQVQAASVVQYLALMLILLAFHVINDAFAGFQRMGLFAMVDVLKMGGSVVFALLVLKAGIAGVRVPIYATVLSYALLAVILVVVFFRSVFPQFFRVRAVLDVPMRRRFMKYGAYIFGAMLGGYTLGNLGSLFLSYYRTLQEVGWYNAAMPTAMILWGFGNAVALVMLPLSSELMHKGERAKLGKGILLVLKYTLLILLPMSLSLALFAPQAIYLLYGANYLPAVLTLRILAIGVLIYSLALMVATTFIGLGKPQVMMWLSLVSAFVNIGLSVLLIPMFGMEGAAVAFSLSFLVMFLVGFALIHRELHGVALTWGKILRLMLSVLVLSGPFVGVVALLKSVLVMNMWLELVLCVIVALAVYGYCVVRFGVISREELALVLNRDIFKA